MTTGKYDFWKRWERDSLNEVKNPVVQDLFGQLLIFSISCFLQILDQTHPFHHPRNHHKWKVFFLSFFHS